MREFLRGACRLPESAVKRNDRATMWSDAAGTYLGSATLRSGILPYEQQRGEATQTSHSNSDVRRDGLVGVRLVVSPHYS